MHLGSRSFPFIGVASLAFAAIVYTPEASAVPSYARQTGQPCATCHTAFPELTPYGRQFKLNGYTAGGTRCGDGSALTDTPQVPLAVMLEPATYTNVKNKNTNLSAPYDDTWTFQQGSVFVAGQLYCGLGAFAQVTYDRPGQAFSWDNTDIRYARSGTIDGTNIVWGMTANNNPTVQDVWNTTPAWAFPYLSSEVAPLPAAGTMLEGTWAQRVGGAGAYVWINNMVYAEISAYGALDPRTLTALGVDPTDGTPRFAGSAPYWRLAVEKTWDKNSLMVGTFGMYADVLPTGNNPNGNPAAISWPGVPDHFTDVGVDAQYQYIGDIHAVTVRASYIWEQEKLNAEFANGFSSNSVDYINSFHVSASYIYDRTISFTTGYFNIWGTTDALFWANSSSGSPNTSGWVFDLSYLPFSHGGPDLWPWFNGKIGITYTHYDKFDGARYNVDDQLLGINGLKASSNDSVFLYTWIAF